MILSYQYKYHNRGCTCESLHILDFSYFVNQSSGTHLGLPHHPINYCSLQALASLTLVALAALCLLAAFTGSTVAIRIVNQSDDEHRSTNALGAYQPLPDLTIVSSTLTLTLCTIAILFMISAAIQLWTFTVVLSYYRYLHAKVRVQPTTALTLSSGRCVDECVLSASYSKAVSGAALAAAVQLSKSTSSSSGGSTSETTTDL